MKRGLFILGHGSRTMEAEVIFSNIVEMVMNITSFEMIGLGSLQNSQPNFEEGIDDLASQGVKEIVIVPLFIFNGNHVQQDIPEALEIIKEKYPYINFIMAKPIGADAKIATIIEERAKTAVNTYNKKALSF